MFIENVGRCAEKVGSGLRNVVLAIFIFVPVTTTATAATQEGLYAAIDAGNSTYKGSCFQSTGNCSESGMAYRLGLGYQTSNGVMFEVSYRARGGSSSSQAGFTTEMQPTAKQFSVIAPLPVNEKFAVLLNVGMVSTSATYKVNGSTSPYISEAKMSNTWGVGALFKFSPSAGIRIQYESLGQLAPIQGVTKVSDFPVSMISAGLVFRLK